MANITSLLNTIKTAIYGRDMRQAIHDAIHLTNDDVETRERITKVSAVQPADWDVCEWWYKVIRVRSLEEMLTPAKPGPSNMYFLKVDKMTEPISNFDNGSLQVKET